MKETNHPTYLFSIDLEDIRFRMPNGKQYEERVKINIDRYLKWLNQYNFKCTFFTVGDIAVNYPDVIKSVVEHGHEIACHTNTHLGLDKMTKNQFQKDLTLNIKNLEDAGAGNIEGFRAPYFSLTEKTSWVFDVLKDFGFKYSSPIYPAPNPFYGWQDFGSQIRILDNGLVEMPMTINTVLTRPIAFSGGVYFRNLPFTIIKRAFAKEFNKNIPVLGYFHPYDIDYDQEKFMHPEINNSLFYNFLIRNNRNRVFERLDKLKNNFDYKIITYKEYLLNSSIL